jgi:hypothetical protein
MFYVLLWIKNNQGEEALRNLPADFRTRLLGREIVAGGPYRVEPGRIARSPLTADQTMVIAPLYERFLAGLTELNGGLRKGRAINNGERYNIDVSTAQQAEALGSTLSFSGPIEEVSVQLATLHLDEPFTREKDLPVAIDQDRARMEIPPVQDEIRRTLRITPRLQTQGDVEMISS